MSVALPTTVGALRQFAFTIKKQIRKKANCVKARVRCLVLNKYFF